MYKIREDLEGKLDSAREVYKVISTSAGTGSSSGAIES